ncbi:MAG: DUF5320 domain-containing protein [Spirochaetales bacterium]|nr:DUF5320 domain-containing protein [Spirochaetales bacterium]
MPRGDRTGPNGMGPMTGRGAGFCAGYTVPGFANPTLIRGGIGRGMGMGRGRGFRHMYYAAGYPGWGGYTPGAYNQTYPGFPPAVTPAGEIEMLKNQAELMRNNLNAIVERISELEKSGNQTEKDG